MERCEKCGAAIVVIELNGKKIPLDRYSMDERYVFDGKKWMKGKTGLSHFTTCQHKKRYRLTK